MRNLIQFLLPAKSGVSLVIELTILTGLFLIGLHNYLLFHGLVEVFSVVISASIFLIAWNARRMVRNSYLLFLGVAFLSVGFIDIIHTLSFKGMTFFSDIDENPATQLWLGARFLQSLSLFLAPCLFGKKIREEFFLAGGFVYLALLFLSIFFFPVFPASYITGTGLTPFKIISEYCIILILIAAIFTHIRHRGVFDPVVLRQIIASIVVAILSEICFTIYSNVYDLLNMAGHLLKVISFFMLYKAIVYTALAKPYNLLFRGLKQSELLLTEERDRAQKYFDIAEVMLVVLSADQRVRRINRKGAAVLGYSVNDIIGKNWLDSFIPVSRREEVRNLFLSLIRGDDPPEITSERFEHPILTASGEERLIAWNNAILRDEQGIVIGTLSSGEDITERRHAEEALRYRELFENVEDAVFIVDRNERFLEANNQVFHMTGYSREELFELGVRGIIPSGQIPLIESIEQELHEKQHLHLEFSFRTRDGAVIPLYISCKVAMFRGERVILCVARDITDLKRLQEKLIRSERLAATGEMAASIVHEIKNPLAIIGGFARSIRKRPEDTERVVRNAGIIVEEIERMERLVADMLDFSRPQIPRLENTDVIAFITKTLSLLEKDMTSRGVVAEIGFSDEYIEYKLDPNQFKQVLINVIQNALNAMPEGGLLRIWITRTGSWLSIDVIDTGQGISRDFLGRVFEPFFTTRGKGTGLGLAISQRIVQSHGGTITLSSEEGMGTTVHIQLPR